jgi:peptidoglycan/LPS O-acetylase OafA/YrhL
MKEHFKNDNQRNGAGEDRALSGLSSFDAQLGPSHMGYIPSLDGLRALAVLAVILYHAHFSWIRGGFIGVEVFFVVSGFLITSLLLEESEDTGGISLRQFWLRRARRLLPALFSMLVAVSAWALLFSKYKVGQLRHDFLSAVFYISNWWQIFSSDVPYFAPKDPPLLRHLWSLAVEEQWYLLWPIAFIALFKWGKNRAKVAQALLVIAAFIMVFTAIAYSSSNSDRINFLYLSTITRSTGLLLGAAGACLWRPWRLVGIAQRGRTSAADMPERVLNLAALVSGSLLVLMALGLTVSGAPLYRGGLVLVSLASLVLVACAVHPNAVGVQKFLGYAPLVEIGKRSYGLYLWHWPIFLFTNARESAAKFFIAVVITAVVTELSYRCIEMPIRNGFIGRARETLRNINHPSRRDMVIIASSYATAAGVLIASVSIALAFTTPIDLSVDNGDDLEFGATTTIAGATPTTLNGVIAPSTTLPTLAEPIRLVIVGDSQAKALAKNLPVGIEKTFTTTDGGVSGCGVYDTGTGISPSIDFKQSFEFCRGWEKKWTASVQKAKGQLALVVLGAWEVLDVLGGGVNYSLGSAQANTFFKTQVKRGIDALVLGGAKVALLEVPCMRPKDVKGAGIPPLPERGDDTRTAQLNQLLQEVANENAATTTFVKGPREWCTSSIIGNDLGYRWDGVHVYKPGAKLIMDTIAPSLLAIPLQ